MDSTSTCEDNHIKDGSVDYISSSNNRKHINTDDFGKLDYNGEENIESPYMFRPIDCSLDPTSEFKQLCLDMASADLEGLELMDIMNYSNFLNCDPAPSDKLRFMEEQQEKLNSSLIALSTHFAQVQLRLKQIVDAPPNEKEVLLKNLEEFAFSGIPEVSPELSSNLLLTNDIEDHEEKIKLQREKQKELIKTLKSQLEELENYAYETGEAGLPQSLVLERQKLILDQLKGKLNLNIDHMDQLTMDDLKNHVDNAIGQLINPMKMKEQLVNQLKTQISDLERFIEFLQGGSAGNSTVCTCQCPLHKRSHAKMFSTQKHGFSSKQNVEMHTKTLNVMKRAAALIQIFVRHQFGDSADHFSKNSLKKHMKFNHYGDLRAQLEVAVADVMELAAEPEAPVDSDYMSDSEGVTTIQCNGKLATAVRKKLAVSIQNLMQHGLMAVGQSNSLVPFIACFPPRHTSAKDPMHAWELILKFYDMKNGEQFNSTPARKLSQSFNLDIVGGSAMSYKQSLLGVIGNIIGTHTPYKRSYDSHFKALVCAGLNSKMLVTWLRLIFRCQPLIELYYQPWSYVAMTGFEDSFASLEKLNQFNFDLPVDLAIRQLQNIKDAF
ncbi:RUN domain-containing protein 1 [Macrosteles quadrilineatus]|uniref:RUN domain-containing protein 1 n=1 Tax=Macrosteles quadrilineatus TaxID=74068 RepID=UPI0023E20843|nr:RUN domain-containing protein 1 [Macrosteles quadrilineatus]